jgi:hypothetical protein
MRLKDVALAVRIVVPAGALIFALVARLFLMLSVLDFLLLAVLGAAVSFGSILFVSSLHYPQFIPPPRPEDRGTPGYQSPWLRGPLQLIFVPLILAAVSVGLYVLVQW